MATPDHNIDYYILAEDGETLIDARGAWIFAVPSETDFEDVEDFISVLHDNNEEVGEDTFLPVIPSLKFLPDVSAMHSVDVRFLLAYLANDPRTTFLTRAERQALLNLRDELPETYQ